MSAPPDADLPPQRLARLLLSGTIGQELLARLGTEFAETRRWDVFAGMTLAWTELQAALIAQEVEVRALRRELAQARRAA